MLLGVPSKLSTASTADTIRSRSRSVAAGSGAATAGATRVSSRASRLRSAIPCLDHQCLQLGHRRLWELDITLTLGRGTRGRTGSGMHRHLVHNRDPTRTPSIVCDRLRP
jgi:hypothetical protein